MPFQFTSNHRLFTIPLIWFAGLLLIGAGLLKLIAPPSVEFCTVSARSFQYDLGLRDRAGALVDIGFQPGSGFAVWDIGVHRAGSRQRADGDAGHS